MSLNRISYQSSATDLTAVDGALKTLEDRLASLIDLTPVQRRTLVFQQTPSARSAPSTQTSLGTAK